MDLKVIRAKRGIHVPSDPERPDVTRFRAVAAGVLALVPANFNLPKDAYEDVTIGKKKKRND